MNNTPEAFREAVRGIPTNHLTQVLTYLTPGHNWNGCSKKLLAERFADTKYYAFLQKIDLQRLARMAKARAAGDYKWSGVK